uniref:Oncostatin M n=1 Tax=Ovis aries TaxID=9940 RepID=A0AC11DXQ2_SHEEP
MRAQRMQRTLPNPLPRPGESQTARTLQGAPGGLPQRGRPVEAQQAGLPADPQRHAGPRPSNAERPAAGPPRSSPATDGDECPWVREQHPLHGPAAARLLGPRGR